VAKVLQNILLVFSDYFSDSRSKKLITETLCDRREALDFLLHLSF